MNTNSIIIIVSSLYFREKFRYTKDGHRFFDSIRHPYRNIIFAPNAVYGKLTIPLVSMKAI